jgi:hypothetical protein
MPLASCLSSCVSWARGATRPADDQGAPRVPQMFLISCLSSPDQGALRAPQMTKERQNGGSERFPASRLPGGDFSENNSLQNQGALRAPQMPLASCLSSFASWPRGATRPADVSDLLPLVPWPGGATRPADDQGAPLPGNGSSGVVMARRVSQVYFVQLTCSSVACPFAGPTLSHIESEICRVIWASSRRALLELRASSGPTLRLK